MEKTLLLRGPSTIIDDIVAVVAAAAALWRWLVPHNQIWAAAVGKERHRNPLAGNKRPMPYCHRVADGDDP